MTIDWEALYKPSPKKKVIKKPIQNTPIESMGSKRKKLSASIKNSIKPSYDDLNEYHKITTQIETELDQQLSKLLKDSQSV